MKQTIRFWLWHRWFGHAGPVEDETFTTEGRPDVSWRTCLGCGRVYPEDVTIALDVLDGDLDVEEGRSERAPGEVGGVRGCPQ